MIKDFIRKLLGKEHKHSNCVHIYDDDFFINDPEYKLYYDNICTNDLSYMFYELHVPKGFYVLHFQNDIDALRFAAKRLDITRVFNQITRTILKYETKFLV